MPNVITCMSQDSSVGIDTTTGWMAGVRIPARLRVFLVHSVQTGSEAHPASYSVRTGGKAARA
jgi:hypothetical protein